MSEKREALRLADELDGMTINDFYEALGDEAAAELRRQHEEITELRHGAGVANQTIADLVAQRDALLEALELLVSYTESCEGLLNASPAGQVLKARAAIKAVEGEKK